MELTKRQEKRLSKVFNDPKQLRKWVDDVYQDMISRCEKQTQDMIMQYLDIYSIATAYTLRYVCGFGKKRLPEVMARIWSNVDCFRTGYLSLEDCIGELEENGIQFENILQGKNLFKEVKDNDKKRKICRNT